MLCRQEESKYRNTDAEELGEKFLAASKRVQRCIGEERYQRILDSVLTLDSDALAVTAAECNFDNSWLGAKKKKGCGEDGQILLHHHGFEVRQESMVMTATAMLPTGISSPADPATPDKKHSPYGSVQKARVGQWASGVE